ncbi:hypothetical protein IV203_003192 [Nitzschia inconspicua]|uniref:Uncharacterized protein n=1 Tax=Nitzschia inconspicua TaxID=303405 RepID=A0A9K3L1P0_9STRA|nr:hypothetical protein IV203_003192 [Nitzschia inconspicua]
MRYFKNEPTKLTLGTHHYTPTKDTFFKSSNKEPYDVSHKHNYVPPTPSSTTTSTNSARYLDDAAQRKHNYIPPVGSNNKNKNSNESNSARPFPVNSSVKNSTSNSKFQTSPRQVGGFPARNKPVKESIIEKEIRLAREKEEAEKAQQEKEREELERAEKEKLEKERKEKEQRYLDAKREKEQQVEAARKLQAFARGALCRARVSNMLLNLIEELLASKEDREKQLQEEKERDYEDVVADAPKSQHSVFAALDSGGSIDGVFEENETDDDDEDFMSGRKTTSILKSSPNTSDMGEGTSVKEGRSISFVDSKNQILEIERAMEYARLPEWWMEYAPHGTLPDDEIDDRYAVVPPSQRVNEEEAKDGELLAAVSSAMKTTTEPTDADESFEEEVVEAEGETAGEHDEVEEEIVEVEEEIVEEEIFEEEVVEDEEVEPTQETFVKETDPEPTPAQETASVFEQSTAAMDHTTNKSSPTTSPIMHEKPQLDETLSTPDVSEMSLAERMKHFQKGPQASVKKNFRAATFR